MHKSDIAEVLFLNEMVLLSIQVACGAESQMRGAVAMLVRFLEGEVFRGPHSASQYSGSLPWAPRTAHSLVIGIDYLSMITWICTIVGQGGYVAAQPFTLWLQEKERKEDQGPNYLLQGYSP